MFGRRVAQVFGSLALAAGLLLAVLPFSFDVGDGEDAVTVHGGPPIVAAWSSVRRGPLLLWAVTNGVTGRTGVELRSGGRPYAARKARGRLLGAAVLLGVGALALVMTRSKRARASSSNAGL